MRLEGAQGEIAIEFADGGVVGAVAALGANHCSIQAADAVDDTAQEAHREARLPGEKRREYSRRHFAEHAGRERAYAGGARLTPDRGELAEAVDRGERRQGHGRAAVVAEDLDIAGGQNEDAVRPAGGGIYQEMAGGDGVPPAVAGEIGADFAGRVGEQLGFARYVGAVVRPGERRRCSARRTSGGTVFGLAGRGLLSGPLMSI